MQIFAQGEGVIIIGAPQVLNREQREQKRHRVRRPERAARY